MRAALVDPEIDRKNAHLAPGVGRALVADVRRVNIVGTSGWIGRTTAALLHDALGPEAFAERVVCFGSRADVIDLDGIAIPQRPLAQLAEQDRRPTVEHNVERSIDARGSRRPVLGELHVDLGGRLVHTWLAATTATAHPTSTLARVRRRG